jgi:beta-N-acetylhexosaminidase
MWKVWARLITVAVLASTSLIAGCGDSDAPSSAASDSTPTTSPAPAGVDLDPGETATPEEPDEPRDPAEPEIVDRLIPFDSERKRQMSEYSQRHYGEGGYRLASPKVIVQHFTASNDFESAYETFAANTPDVELKELPGVCSHFIIDTDGTIYRLVPVTIRCRHTVGLNWTSIGIEHVGTSDAQVMGNAKQRKSSLKLTNYLRCTSGIDVKDVIGHNENTSSPYHRELVPELKTQTHGDFTKATMDRYRRLLAERDC